MDLKTHKPRSSNR